MRGRSLSSGGMTKEALTLRTLPLSIRCPAHQFDCFEKMDHFDTLFAMWKLARELATPLFWITSQIGKPYGGSGSNSFCISGNYLENRLSILVAEFN